MKQVPLTKGMVALVDDEDFERVMQHSWCANKVGKIWYAQSRIKGKAVLMHRFILDVPCGKNTDHVNHDGLDNRRSNIRACSQSQNCANSGMRANNKNGFKGVLANHKGRSWCARIRKDYKQYYFCGFKTREEAARKYDQVATEWFGEFALTNQKLGLLP